MKVEKPDWLVQMEGILETLNEGVLIIDDCSVILFANDRFQQLTALPAEDIVGRTPEHFYQGAELEYLYRKRDEGIGKGSNRYEFFVPAPNGARIPVIISARSIEDPDGRSFAVLTFTDISEQKAAEAQLFAANQGLEKRAREIEAELELASRVQQSLAPRALVWGKVAVEASYLPVSHIGGDFGLVAPVGDGHLNLLVCDVSGHGISSALVANRIYTETISLLERRVEGGEMLRQLNRFVTQQIRVGGFFFTMTLARVNEAGDHVHYASGGHPPALLVSDSGVRQVFARGTVLGLLEDAIPEHAAEDIPLAHGDRLVLYTDGLLEVWNDRDEELGLSGLTEIVKRAAALPLAEMKEQILADVAAWRHGPVTDDISLVVLERR